MQQIIVLTILTLSLHSFAQNQVPKFSHWLPSIQLNLYNEIENLEKSHFDTRADIEKENQNAMKMLNTKSSKVFHRKEYITVNEAEELHRKLVSDPVANADKWTYDPDLKYGYCFGRATSVWLNALDLGMDKDSVKKIFLVGPMKAAGFDWQFHVATAIRSKDIFSERWLIVDKTFNRPVTIHEFYNFFKQFNTDQKLRMIVTEPQRLVPSSTEKFGPRIYKNIENDYMYNKYFQDLLRNFSNKANFKRTNLCKYLF